MQKADLVKTLSPSDLHLDPLSQPAHVEGSDRPMMQPQPLDYPRALTT